MGMLTYSTTRLRLPVHARSSIRSLCVRSVCPFTVSAVRCLRAHRCAAHGMPVRTPRAAVEELSDEQRHRGARYAGDSCQLGELGRVHACRTQPGAPTGTALSWRGRWQDGLRAPLLPRFARSGGRREEEEESGDRVREKMLRSGYVFCARGGVQLDAVGPFIGHTVDRRNVSIPNYDLCTDSLRSP